MQHYGCVFFVVVTLFMKSGYGLMCLQCQGILNPLQCRRVAECPNLQGCGINKITNEFGEDLYNLGCRNKQTCRNATSANSCTSCCFSDLCNSEGCGVTGYPSSRGPICYSCSNPTTSGHCHDIDHCEYGEACHVKGYTEFGEDVYTTKCLSKHLCRDSGSASGLFGRREIKSREIQGRSHEIQLCNGCCEGDLCNTECSNVTMTTTSSGVMDIDASDCYEVQQKLGPLAQSGIYTITTWRSQTKVKVYCDMTTDGGGWTVFHHRFDGSVNFDRNFSDYEHGFGSLSGEFWLGLMFLEEIAAQNTSTLRMDLTGFDGWTAVDVYVSFSLDSGPDYTLHAGSNLNHTGMLGPNLLVTHVNYPFSAYDHDVDSCGCNCAREDHGGFWFHDCFHLNPNGLYNGTQDRESMSMTDWSTYKRAKTWTMMTRRG